MKDNEVFWLIADRDVFKQEKVLKMNIKDIINAYRQALERVFERRIRNNG